MTRTRTVAALAVAVIAAGCLDEEELQPDPTPPSLDGAWTYCGREQEVAQDEWETFFFDGDEMQRVMLEYASSDGSCTGAVHGSVAEVWDWTIALGPEVATTLAGVPVTARTLDSAAHHTVVYVDAAATPDALYIGDPTADAEKDGSTADARPTVLWEARPHAREAPATFDVRALQGSWAACAERSGGDSRMVLAFDGYRLTIVETTYASTDGSCAGAASPTQRLAVLALRGEVPATLGAKTVIARELDMPDMGSASYTIVYLDRAVTPNVLYVGDELADAERDGTTPERRPSVLGQGSPLVRQ